MMPTTGRPLYSNAMSVPNSGLPVDQSEYVYNTYSKGTSDEALGAVDGIEDPHVIVTGPGLVAGLLPEYAVVGYETLQDRPHGCLGLAVCHRDGAGV